MTRYPTDMHDWRAPGKGPPAPDESDWIELSGDPSPPTWPEAPGNRDRVPPIWILAYFGGSALLCLLAGLIAMAGLSLRGRTWLGWAAVGLGLILFPPAAALGFRAITLILIALSQVGNRRSGS